MQTKTDRQVMQTLVLLIPQLIIHGHQALLLFSFLYAHLVERK